MEGLIFTSRDSKAVRKLLTSGGDMIVVVVGSLLPLYLGAS